jgi:hypothetical protein
MVLLCFRVLHALPPKLHPSLMPISVGRSGWRTLSLFGSPLRLPDCEWPPSAERYPAEKGAARTAALTQVGCTQNNNFSASCSCRGSRAVSTLPKVPLVELVRRVSKLVWFRTLNASARN